MNSHQSGCFDGIIYFWEIFNGKTFLCMLLSVLSWLAITPRGVLEFVKGAGILTDLTGCDDCLENTFDCLASELLNMTTSYTISVDALRDIVGNN